MLHWLSTLILAVNVSFNVQQQKHFSCRAQSRIFGRFSRGFTISLISTPESTYLLTVASSLLSGVWGHENWGSNPQELLVVWLRVFSMKYISIGKLASHAHFSELYIEGESQVRPPRQRLNAKCCCTLFFLKVRNVKTSWGPPTARVCLEWMI